MQFGGIRERSGLLPGLWIWPDRLEESRERPRPACGGAPSRSGDRGLRISKSSTRTCQPDISECIFWGRNPETPRGGALPGLASFADSPRRGGADPFGGAPGPRGRPEILRERLGRDGSPAAFSRGPLFW